MQERKWVTGLQHIGLPTADIDKTTAFYEGLGFRVAYRTVNQSSAERVAFLQLKNIMIETYQTPQAAGKPGAIDHIALGVDDIEKAFSELSQGGYTLLDKEIQFLPFWEKGVRFFTIMGPNGEKIEYCQKC